MSSDPSTTGEKVAPWSDADEADVDAVRTAIEQDEFWQAMQNGEGNIGANSLAYIAVRTLRGRR